MDGRKFDALTRSLSYPTNRRVTLRGLTVGLLGLGLTRHAAAQSDGPTAEACHIERCKKAVLRQPCLDRDGRPDNHRCCKGLKCSDKKGVCVFKNGHGDAGDYCRRNDDCNRGFFCKKNQCVPNSCNS